MLNIPTRPNNVIAALQGDARTPKWRLLCGSERCAALVRSFTMANHMERKQYYAIKDALHLVGA